MNKPLLVSVASLTLNAVRFLRRLRGNRRNVREQWHRTRAAATPDTHSVTDHGPTVQPGRVIDQTGSLATRKR